jgi:hypothetical protein
MLLHFDLDFSAKSRINGRPAEQAILVTGSARMETFRQEQDRNQVAIRRAGDWLAELEA